MKTNLLTIATALLLIAGVNQASLADNPASEKFITLPKISGIEKIEARGNVDLYILSGDSDKVEINHNYYQDNALIQETNGALRITNYRPEKLKVWVTAADLRNLVAYDDVSVTSLGKFKALDLILDLYGRAYANLEIDCINTDLRLNENSKADLKGYAYQSNLLVNYAATANVTHFLADNIYRKRVTPVQQVFSRLTILAMVNKPDIK